MANKKEIIIVSFSKESSNNTEDSANFDEKNLVYKNLLLSSFFKFLSESWIKDLFLNEDSELKKAFKNNSECFKNAFSQKYNEYIIEMDSSILWSDILKKILEYNDKGKDLVKEIDDILKTEKSCKIIGFQKYNESDLYYFNTDQLYDVKGTKSEKPYLPDFLVQAWCDAYNKEYDKHDFRLVIHDKEIDGFMAGQKGYDYCCEFMDSKSEILFLPCRIFTFSHLPSDKMFKALTNKKIEGINKIFNSESFSPKNDLEKCCQSINTNKPDADSKINDTDDKLNLKNDFRLSKLSGVPNVLNYVIELLQNYIMENRLSENKTPEAIIELNEIQKKDFIDAVVQYNSAIKKFHDTIIAAIKDNKTIVVSADQIQLVHTILSSILELTRTEQ